MTKITPPKQQHILAFSLIYILALKPPKLKRTQSFGEGGAITSSSAREALTGKHST